jgi:AcrR family transcriptional regulator
MTDYVAELKELYRALAPPEDPHSARSVKRQRIVEAASRLFVHYGYRKTSVDDVAREAGVAKGTVYLYYTTKAELLAHSILLEQQGRFDQLMSLFERQTDPRSRLVETVRIHLLSCRHMPIMAKLLDNTRDMVEALAEAETVEHLQHDETNTRLLTALVDDAFPGRFTPAQLAERVSLLTATVTGVALLDESLIDGLTAERLADLLSEILVEGLASDAGGTATPRRE